MPGAATIARILPQSFFQSESVSGIPIDQAIVSSHIYGALCKRFRVSVRAAYTLEHGIHVAENHDNVVGRIDTNNSDLGSVTCGGPTTCAGESYGSQVGEFSILVQIDENDGLPGSSEAIRAGFPLPRGPVRNSERLYVRTEDARVLPHQARPLAHWSDLSIKWLLPDALLPVAPYGTTTLRVERDCPAATTALTASSTISLHRSAQSIQIDAVPARLEIPVSGRKLVSSVEISGQSLPADRGIIAQLLDAHGTRSETDTEQLVVEVEGSI